MGFLKVLRSFADYCDKGKLAVEVATVSVTEQYARRVLGVKKDQPLVYRGLKLKCVGSKRWRMEHLSE